MHSSPKLELVSVYEIDYSTSLALIYCNTPISLGAVQTLRTQTRKGSTYISQILTVNTKRWGKSMTQGGGGGRRGKIKEISVT